MMVKAWALHHCEEDGSFTGWLAPESAYRPFTDLGSLSGEMRETNRPTQYYRINKLSFFRMMGAASVLSFTSVSHPSGQSIGQHYKHYCFGPDCPTAQPMHDHFSDFAPDWRAIAMGHLVLCAFSDDQISELLNVPHERPSLQDHLFTA